MDREEPHCTECGPEARGVFCVLAGVHLQRLDREKAVHHYRRGETIFREGNPPLAVFCVYSGLVKLFKTSRRGEEQVIRLLGPGEIVGYRALLTNEPYAATAEALEPTTICMVSKPTLITLIRESPELALRLLARLGHELRHAEDQMVRRTEETVKERAAQLLLWLSMRDAKAGDAEDRIGGSLQRAEMAQMIGTTPETMSRTLKLFARRGLINLTRTSIKISDRAGLEKIAHGRISK